jgi:hypothetical protein
MEQPPVRPVEKPDDNVWHARTRDGQDRSHIPPMARRLFFVRIAQLVLAVAYLVLAAFAAFTLNASTVSLVITNTYTMLTRPCCSSRDSVRPPH